MVRLRSRAAAGGPALLTVGVLAGCSSTPTASDGSSGADADADALVGAQGDTDPPLDAADMTGPGAEVGGWAERSTTVEAVFDWMYDDGVIPAGSDANGDGSSGCYALGDAICWGHRQGILENWADASFGGPGTYTLTFGAACVPVVERGDFSPLSCTWEGYLS